MAQTLIVLFKINVDEVFVRRFFDFSRHLSRQTQISEDAPHKKNKKIKKKIAIAKNGPTNSVAQTLIVLFKINAAEVFVRRFFDFYRDLLRQTLGLEAENRPTTKGPTCGGHRFVREW